MVYPSLILGSYDDSKAYEALNDVVLKKEQGFEHTDRVFYMALPPTAFAAAPNGLKHRLYTTKGTNRIIVEKPFGKDTESSQELGKILANNWQEEEVFISLNRSIVSIII